MESRTHIPEEIACNGEQIFGISFHPRADLLAIASITGLVEVFHYGAEASNSLVFQSLHHGGSCRGVQFSEDGGKLYSISSDKSWKAVDTQGAVICDFANAHDSAINKLELLSEGVIATGDDSGYVKIWDTRHNGPPVLTWKLHEDFISDFCYSSETSMLLSVSGDATLCAYDIRKSSNTFRSDDQESEMHCLSVIKNGRKVVCGTQDGVILIFSWDKWGDCSDRYPGHPETVDSIVQIDENTILTGSSDGMIRAVAIQPNKVIGVIGDHEEFPVEGVKKSRDNRILASYAHDQIVRFWDISMFEDDDDDDADEEVPTMKQAGGAVTKGSSMNESDSDGADQCDDEEEDNEEDGDEGGWEDLPDGEEDSDMDESDDGTGGGGKASTKKILTASEKFFADL